MHIPTWLRPPALSDEILDRRAQILFTSQAALMVATLTVAAISILSGWSFTLGVLLFCLGVDFVSFYLLRRGQVRSSGLLLLAVMLVVTFLFMARGNGIHDIAVMLFPVVLLISSLALDRRDYMVVAVVTISLPTLFTLAEYTGRITTLGSPLVTPEEIILAPLLLALVAFSVRQLADSLLQSVESSYRLVQQQAGLTSQAQQQAEQLALLNRIGSGLNSALELEQAMQALYQAVCELVPVDSFYVALYNPQDGEISFPFFINPDGRVQSYAFSIYDKPGLSGLVILRARTLYIPDVQEPEIMRHYQINWMGPKRTRTFIGIPLIVKDQVIGVLSVQSGQIDAYSPEQIALLETIAAQAVGPLENARLFSALQTSQHTLEAELEERRKAENALNQRDAILEAVAFAAATFLALPDWRMGVLSVLERLGANTHASHAYLCQNQVNAEDSLSTSMIFEWTGPQASAYLPDMRLLMAELPFPHSAAWFAALNRGETYQGSSQELQPGDMEFPLFEGPKAFLSVPVMTAGSQGEPHWWGFLGFDDARPERRWSQVEVEALKVAASILGAAIVRQQADQQIYSLNAQLERRVQERTAELESSNRELESFAYSVAHDLKAPLRGIDGYSHLLLDEYGEALDEQGSNYLKNVRRAAQWMGHLIEDLLQLSRLARLDMQREALDLSWIALQVMESLQASDQDRQVQWIVQQGLEVMGDPRLMGIALDNLLRNAWKFSRTTAKACIEVGSKLDDGELVYFVHDNGVGFDMRFANKLFRPFQRLHDPTEYEGTGIGLAIAARIIRRHGGRIWAEGAVGQGATFYFTLS